MSRQQENRRQTPNFPGMMAKHFLRPSVCLVRVLLLTVALLAAGLPCPAQSAPPGTPTRFTINVVEAPVADVLHALFMAARRNYTMYPQIGGNVTLTANNVTFQQALAVLLDSAYPPLAAQGDINSPDGVININSTGPPMPETGPEPPELGNSIGPNCFLLTPQAKRPPVTAAQAIARARAFCRRIGQPVQGPVVLSSSEDALPIPPQYQNLLNQPTHYWQPLWQIIFPGQAFVEVSAVSGVIASYQDTAPRQPKGVVVQPNGLVVISMTMRRADAIRRAKRIMAATYQPEQGLLAHAGGHLDNFRVTWTRAYDGIPYNDVDNQFAENSGVVFDAHTGRVLSVKLGYLSPPVTGPVGRVTADEALRTATAYASTLGANSNGWTLDDPNDNPLLRVVCLYSGPHPHSCAVWIVKFFDGPVATTPWFDDILVDSETGQVLLDQHLGVGSAFGGGVQ